MERDGFRAAIEGGDSNEDVLHIRFGIFDEDIEIAMVEKNSRIEQFKFRLASAAPRVFFDQSLVGEFGLRILVQHAHVTVCGSRIKIEVALFHILAVVALIPGHAKEAFLEDGIAAVPERETETHHLVAVADSADTVFAPAIRARARMVVREIFPRRAIAAVVFPNRAPLALGKVGSPALPILLVLAALLEAAIFYSCDSWHRAMSLKGETLAMVAFFLPKTQSVQKERWLRPLGGRPFVATGDLPRLQSCRFCDAPTTQEKQSAASVADKEPAGDGQALYSRAPLVLTYRKSRPCCHAQTT